MLISANIRTKIHSKLPDSAGYLKQCILDFQTIRLTQDTTITDSNILAEPLWHNYRFNIPLNYNQRKKWINPDELNTVLISDLFAEDGSRFTEDQWDDWFHLLAPADIAGTPKAYDYAATALGELRTILRTIPITSHL